MQRLRYEHLGEPLLPRRKFLYRIWQHFLVALAVVVLSMVLGMVGYHWLAKFSWIDSFLNAAMLLGGMGPVGDIPTDSGKLFAGFYALYSGLVLIVSAGVLLTPVLHRLMHHLHLEGRAGPRS
jgi:hypothetical protein